MGENQATKLACIPPRKNKIDAGILKHRNDDTWFRTSAVRLIFVHLNLIQRRIKSKLKDPVPINILPNGR